MNKGTKYQILGAYTFCTGSFILKVDFQNSIGKVAMSFKNTKNQFCDFLKFFPIQGGGGGVKKSNAFLSFLKERNCT